MNEFIGKLIGKLEEKANQTWLVLAERNGYERAIEIVNQLAEEYNNDFCEWKQEDEEGFSNCKFTYQEIMNDEVEGFKFCPYCGKKIKIAPYQPKGE